MLEAPIPHGRELQGFVLESGAAGCRTGRWAKTSVAVSATRASPLVAELRPFTLLVRGQDLIERSLCFGAVGNRLRNQVAEVRCSLVNRILVVARDRRLQAIMRGLHAAVHGCLAVCGVGEDSCRLFLLLRCETQLVRQELNMTLHPCSGIV